PIMIHRAPFGSMERFIAVLIEHCAGNFPLWLAPEQLTILPISEKFADYATSVQAQLEESGIRAMIDHRDEKIGRKIRDAEMKKLPYMIIVGEKEAETQTLSVRRHGEGDQGSLSVSEFVTQFQAEIEASIGK
ncbi:MAG TPA: His/Gly/Thr/Pro-type tRNA ligase C-terminal domain-containing protein, partial [Catalimonadaceae bacterium]|nr:His/Gly/Thr/Pro-type tRNA ligase C-terminal domain-containing protein [Catalimonadaceae bacterium]